MFEQNWYKENVHSNKKDYGMNGELDNEIEKLTGNHLILSGPCIDLYLEEIAKGITSKLSRRGNLTGLITPYEIFVPWQIMRYITGMCIGYGADVKNICHGKKQIK